ncbi:radical SAM protein [Desulfogranum mediterraneum]|uniref:radical SAM protein n=1 Tax=Desulfogranum mediterraneum TaxID=160661 RepID=UPI0004018DD5|nr:hypothetical protein [Desulfogranum mediterraneum]
MNCEILHTLYIKSNGEVLCNDDFGERILLGRVSSETTAASLDELLNNEAYGHIRSSLAAGRVPWEGVCEECAFLRSEEPFADPLAEKRLSKLQLEPSLLCNLDCRCCSNDLQITTREQPHLMEPATYEAVLSALRNRGYRLDSVEYCGQGEPLMHPRFAEFVQLTKRYYPQAWQRLITNGNVSYERTVGAAPLDEVMVAGDGLYQESYAQYRVKGRVEKVLRFMGDGVAAKERGRPLVIWKYILFEFNDSKEELLAAQERARELGVDTLVFVVTHSQYHSQRYTMESIASLPIVQANVTTNAHPSFFDGVLYGSPQRSLIAGLGEKLRRRWQARIDEVMIMPGELLQLRGWAAAETEIALIRLYAGDAYLGETLPTDLRPDVEAVYPRFRHQPLGFRFSAQLEGVVEKISLTLHLYDHQQEEIGRLSAPFVFALEQGAAPD